MTNWQAFDQPDFTRHREAVENVLTELLEHRSQTPPPIREAMEYATLQGGKRVRSVLVVGMTEDLGGPRADALLVGAVLEIVHAASLILDDLPCMDDAPQRRGRPATHMKFGEAGAILTSFALINLAYEILAHLPSLSPVTRCELASELARTIGSSGLIAGQWLDLTTTPDEATLEDIERIHRLKTAVLFECAAAMTGMINEVGEVGMSNLRRFGRAYGQAFQIVDDLMDWFGNEAEMGKPAAQDQKKVSYQGLNKMQEAFERFEALSTEAYRIATGAVWHHTAQLLLEPLLAIYQMLRLRAMDAR